PCACPAHAVRKPGPRRPANPTPPTPYSPHACARTRRAPSSARTTPGPPREMRDNGSMSEGETKTAEAREMKDRGAFTRYRVMAFVTGGMLLLLCLEMLLKYVVQVNGFGQ